MALAAPALEAPGTGIDWNELLSITTLPLRDCGSGEYGKLPFTDTGVSGSWRWRRSFQTDSPRSAPMGVLQAVEQLGGLHLAAAALAEQLALDGVERDHVVARPGLVRSSWTRGTRR